MDNNSKNRKKRKYPCPNPLFEKWLKEWQDDAREKGLRAQYTYGKALSSLKKYPLPLASGKEAKILEFFGDKICAMLDAKLLEYSKAKVFSSDSQSSQETDASTSSASSTSVPSLAFTEKRKVCSPRKSKDPIEVKVLNKGRMFMAPKPVHVPEVVEEVISEDDIPINDNSFYLIPGSFNILLCVDNCETFAGQGRNKQLFISELQKCGVHFEVRKLHVGDFLWIAQENYGDHRELVLDFIVERKRLDDLAKSIKDGRFREQKFRMKNCGLRNPVYLVENHGSAKYCGLPEATLEQAIVNTQIIDGFLIKRTQSVKESVTYLSLMTKLIRNRFQNQTLISAPRETVQKKKKDSSIFMTFKEFNCSSMKNKSLTVKEMFAKHLLQFFGLSVDRAAAIVENFETPVKFFEAYSNCVTEEEKIHLVSSIKFGIHKKNIGPALSRALYQFYCAVGPLK